MNHFASQQHAVYNEEGNTGGEDLCLPLHIISAHGCSDITEFNQDGTISSKVCVKQKCRYKKKNRIIDPRELRVRAGHYYFRD